MVTCRDIVNLNMEGVELIAGAEGLNRMVSVLILKLLKRI